MSLDPFLNNDILRNIHDNAVDAIITIDRQGIMKSANPAAIKLLGYDLDELLGQNVKMITPSPFQQRHDSYLVNCFKTGIANIIGIGREVAALRKDGTIIPVHLAVSSVQSGGETVFVGFLRDLTSYKESEAKLHSKVLMNERLAAIGQTISGLAHESRNAFQRSHACLAELELDLEGMPSSLNLVHKIQRALDDLHHLLEEVRNYASPIILERRELSIERLIREVWQNILDARCQEHPPTFTLTIEPDFPASCLVDGDRFKQVVRNLIDNAWFACKEPKCILIHLSFCDPLSADAPCICRVEVNDNGDGVAIQDGETIFTPFYTTKTKGTGLGLALCRRYIEAHEGRIFVNGPSVGPQDSSRPCPVDSLDASRLPGASFIIEFPYHSKNANPMKGP